MFYTYKITNTLTRKTYFGYTSQTPMIRFHGHHAEPRNTLISRSMRKYGKSAHLLEVVGEHSSETQAKKHERELIAEHKTNTIRFPDERGLNMTDGGEGCSGYKHTEAQKKAWKRQRKGKTPACAYTVKHSKQVYQFSTKGKQLASFPSAVAAARSVQDSGANVSKCCNNIIKTVKGYIFQYTSPFVERQFNNITAITQLTLDGNVVQTFPSIKAAVEQLNLKNRSGIDKCLMGTIKTSAGYRWVRT